MGDPAYVAFFEDPTRYPDDLSALWRPYMPTMSHTLTAGSGTKRLYSALKDKAGNISALVYDEIILNELITLNMVLMDRTRFDTDFTNENTILVRLNTAGTPPARYYLSETNTLNPDRWLLYPSDSVVNFSLSSGEGEKTVYGWVLSESDIVSEMARATIVLDKTAPVLTSGFMIYDTTRTEVFPTVFRAHPGWSNSIEVWAAITRADDNLSGVDSVGFFGPLGDPWRPTAYNPVDGGLAMRYMEGDSFALTFTPGEGQKWITGRALDGAGNWGNVPDHNSEIIVYGGLDYTPPTLGLLDPITLSPAESIGVVIPRDYLHATSPICLIPVISGRYASGLMMSGQSRFALNMMRAGEPVLSSMFVSRLTQQCLNLTVSIQ
jgi:hypothetical protein